MEFEKINAPSVREVFVREIEDKIFSGELQVGEKLPSQKELCSSMGISLTVVNAGIAELSSKGLVQVVPRRGVFISDYRVTGTPETFFDLMQFNGEQLPSREIQSFTETRVALDPYVMKLVIERATDEQLKALKSKVLATRKEEITDLEFCDRITDAFQEIYRMTDNTFLSLLYHSTIKPQIGMYSIFIQKNGRELVIKNIENIYKALCQRDLPNAEKYALEGMNYVLTGTTAIVELEQEQRKMEGADSVKESYRINY